MSETPAEELYLRGYRPASKTWSGLVRWLPVSLPAEDDVRYIRADLHDAQAAQIARFADVVEKGDKVIHEQAAQIERLREALRFVRPYTYGIERIKEIDKALGDTP